MSQLDKLERILAGEQASWSEDWPTEPGYYWFYGWRFRAFRGVRDRPPKMYLVRVRCIENRLVFDYHHGYTLYKAETEGYWMPARLPEPPTELAGGKHNE